MSLVQVDERDKRGEVKPREKLSLPG